MMAEKKDEEVKKEVRKNTNGVRFDMTFVDVPLNIAKVFRSDVRTKYGNIYWVKLMDLMRKAEAYDHMIATGEVLYEPVQEEEPEKKKEDEEEGVMAFGGLIKNG